MNIERQEEKYCSKCRRLLPLTEYPTWRYRSGRVYIRPECKGCMREYRKEWRKLHPEYYKRYSRRRREEEKQNINHLNG